MPVELLWYTKAIREAVRLHSHGDIDKKEFRFVRSLMEDTWACVAFSQMSDELRMDWIAERAKEVGGPTSNTKAKGQGGGLIN